MTALGWNSLYPIVGAISIFVLPEIRKRFGPVVFAVVAIGVLVGLAPGPIRAVISILDDETMSSSYRGLMLILYSMLGIGVLFFIGLLLRWLPGELKRFRENTLSSNPPQS